jgi:hypothetical protein
LRTFRDLIKLWPSRVAFAREVGLGYEAAAAMYGRGFIHPHHWPRLLDAARRRGFEVTADNLVAMSDRRRRPRSRRRASRSDAANAAA